MSLGVGGWEQGRDTGWHKGGARRCQPTHPATWPLERFPSLFPGTKQQLHLPGDTSRRCRKNRPEQLRRVNVVTFARVALDAVIFNWT